MPVSNRKPQQVVTASDCLRPYAFHGLDLTVRGGHGIADCPFCGREGKFSADVSTGLWRCFVCGSGTAAGGGNALVFLRLLHERSLPEIAQDAPGRRDGVGRVVPRSGTFGDAVVADRRLCDPSTPAAWGVCPSAVDGSWLVPGYGPDGRLDQVYRRVLVSGSWRLLPTPGVWPEGKVHALHLPVGDFDPDRKTIYICEGPWDAMALWECRAGLLGDCNVIAVPGCNVWRDDWTAMCRGKNVVLMFDSDHPRVQGGRTFRAGFDGMYRVAKRLSGSAASVRWLRWGREGWDESRPSGWDVRDVLSGTGSTPLLMVDRMKALGELILKVEDAPADWFSASVHVTGSSGRTRSIESRECRTWTDCEAAWDSKRGGALLWRQDLGDALTVLLAVAASTQQAGNQLFLDLIGSPGSAKTTLCSGLLVSSHCIALDNITKILSGYKKPGDDSADCSFLARANGKTWITCEFDVVANMPQYHDLMGKIRRIFDGEITATYGNSDEDRMYQSLRTPWIRAGTYKMMDHDQSQLGDRFMRFILSDPDDTEKRSIVMAALESEHGAMLESANGRADSITDPKTRIAYALTGGYVDWLRANVETLLPRVQCPIPIKEACADLAELSSDLRARPTHEDKRKPNQEVRDGKELPTRLARQFYRLACCITVVRNKQVVDADVMRIVRKVAMDTAHGHSLNIVRWLCRPNPRAPGKTYQSSGGIMEGTLEQWTHMSQERLEVHLSFLKRIGVLRHQPMRQSKGSWLLTDRVYDLYLRIMRR